MRLLRLAFILSALLVSASSILAKGGPKPQFIHFTYDDEDRTATLYIPEQPGPLPVLVLLHGSGRSGDVMVHEWKDLAAREGIVLVAPDAGDPWSWNLGPDSPDFLHATVDQAAALHPIDRTRIYMFGNSAGAEYVLILSLLDSTYFAAAALHAGILLPAFNNAFDQAERHMPIAIWSGDHDFNFPPEEVRATQRLFKSHGFDVRLAIMAQHDHNYYAVSGEVNRRAWEFLKSTRLPAPPEPDR